MALFTENSFARASEFRRRMFPITEVLSADWPIASSTTLLPVPGLGLLLEIGRNFAFEGYIAYTAATAGDVQFAVTTSARGFGRGQYSVVGTAQAAGTNPGNMEGSHTEGLEAESPFSLVGDTEPLSAFIHGYIDVGNAPTLLQLNAAQVASSASATTIKAGSWIRATEIDL